MEIDFDNLTKLIAQLGVAVAMALILWYAVFVPRKRKSSSGEDVKSALLVPGWIYEEAKSETERVRTMYARMLLEEQQRSELRITEWRGFRDEEKARRIDAENDTKKLLTAIDGLASDVAFLVEIQRITGGDRRGARNG